MVRIKSAGIQEDLTLEGVRLLAVQVDKKKENMYCGVVHFGCKYIFLQLALRKMTFSL